MDLKEDIIVSMGIWQSVVLPAGLSSIVEIVNNPGMPRAGGQASRG
ncbi:MAG: hypothetical protein ACO2ER_05955 [Castellaniella sp.]